MALRRTDLFAFFVTCCVAAVRFATYPWCGGASGALLLYDCEHSSLLSQYVAAFFYRISLAIREFAVSAQMVATRCWHGLHMVQSKLLSRAASSKDRKASRLFLDLEVISETIFVVVVGGPGSLVWMVGTLSIMMLINICNAYFGTTRCPSGQNTAATSGRGRGIPFVLYSACMLCITVYNTILFQTKQFVIFLPATTSYMPYIAVLGLILIVIMMTMYQRLIAALYSITAAVTAIYVMCLLVSMCSSSTPLISAFQVIIDNATSAKAMLCGYIAACAIGSYVLNVKNSNNIYYGERSIRHVVCCAICEYILTIALCIATGLAVVLSGSYELVPHVHASLTASMITDSTGVLRLLIPVFAAIIIMTETYYGYQYWKEALLKRLIQNKTQFKCSAHSCLWYIWSTILKSAPLWVAVIIMLCGSGIIKVDVMHLVHVSDKLTGFTIFFPIIAMLARKSARSKQSATIHNTQAGSGVVTAQTCIAIN